MDVSGVDISREWHPRVKKGLDDVVREKLLVWALISVSPVLDGSPVQSEFEHLFAFEFFLVLLVDEC